MLIYFLSFKISVLKGKWE